MSESERVFEPFQKIPRLRRNCVITEKIDGTNASVWISDDCTEMRFGSRNRWITPDDDNAGFARWATENADELRKLGPGHHFGEWWGAGIQRRYGLSEKRFSLFNTSRWQGVDVPSCCHVVPVIYAGLFRSEAVDEALEVLGRYGSLAAPGFMRPEGVIVYLSAARSMFKVTLEKDDEPKGAVLR